MGKNHAVFQSITNSRVENQERLRRNCVQRSLMRIVAISLLRACILAVCLGWASWPVGYAATNSGFSDVTGFSNVTIVSGTALSGVSKSGTNPVIYTPTADSATIGVDDISAELNAGNSVVVLTTNAGGIEVGSITINATIAKTSGSSADITLTANANISIGPFGNAGISNSIGGNVTLNANLAGTTGGAAGIVSGGAGTDITTVNGDISLTGKAGTGRGIDLFKSNITTTGNGSITINGVGGGAGIGVYFFGDGDDAVEITTVDGDVTITGTGGSDAFQTGMESRVVPQ